MQARRILAVVVALMFGAVACGGSSKSASSTSSSTTPSNSRAGSSSSSGATQFRSSESADAGTPCALLSNDEVSAAVGAPMVLENNVHCRWETADGQKKVDLEVLPLASSGYKTADEFTAAQTGPVFTLAPSPPNAFFDNGLSGIKFVTAEKFVSLDVTLDADSQDFNYRTDKTAEKAVLEPLADTVASRL